MPTAIKRVMKLHPFGVVVLAEGNDHELAEVSGIFLRGLLDRHPFVLLRGFEPMGKVEMEQCWRDLGTAFSSPREFVARDWPMSHLFGRERVPLHCDEILTGRSPTFSVIQCYGAQEPGGGGETFLCDSSRVLGRATAEQRRRWGGITLEYRVPGCVSVISQPLVALHRNGRTPVLRYAEPFDRGELGALWYSGVGMSKRASDALASELKAALFAAPVTISLTWRLNDILITDDHRTLHGRSALEGPEPYPFHLRRTQVFY
ncbi:TauD/TfdA family dioxygenase [Amycolatopsis sp. EV170708-02-1]|uniref:TauD/TfdA family dioxygenase n=1 Tax=Amycolatopsis sp. EV170708-02-1 TaxID=2919322 RepID=UPI001F0B9F1C|nr:TauD/TfdA family dioxygenase [Amycolatopsis sp. EV170708-02-1]UMP06925.1 TauD/TfdA family dioxygenase [Amycolatopsis sp. EV170708-02-1]